MVKLTRNKLVAECVLYGNTLASVGVAFGISAPNVRRITQNIVGKTAGYGINPTNKIQIQAARHAPDIINKVRALTAEDYRVCKCPGKMKLYRSENRKIV